MQLLRQRVQLRTAGSGAVMTTIRTTGSGAMMTTTLDGWPFGQGKAGRRNSVDVLSCRLKDGSYAWQFDCGHCGQRARMLDPAELLCADCWLLTRLPGAPDMWDFCGKPARRARASGTWESRPHLLRWLADGEKPACDACAAEKMAAFVKSFLHTTNAIAACQRSLREVAEAERRAEREAAARRPAELLEDYVTGGNHDALAEYQLLPADVAVTAADATVKPAMAL